MLCKAVKKYGKENFCVSILEECDSEEELVEKEEFWIRYYDAVENDAFYNLTYSGYTRGVQGYKHSEEAKQKCARYGPDNGFYGKGLFGEANGFYGKHHSETSRLLMREHHADVSGEHNPNYGKRGVDSPNYGTKRSEEQKQRISAALKGKERTPEHINNIRLSKLGTKQSAEQREKHSIRCKELNIRPPSVKGKIFVTNDVECHLIDPSEFDTYVKQGYRRGKTQKDASLWKDAGHRHSSTKGKIVVHHPEKLKDTYIMAEELDNYLSKGFVLGGKPRKRH